VPSTETLIQPTSERPPRTPGTVLVTGGASGLGAAVANAVQRAGGTPVVLDLAAAQEGIDSETVDLADGRAAEAAVRRAAERHGGLDAVVTAAGIDACGRLTDVDPNSWERVIAVNLLGTAAVVRAALPFLAQARGRVVTVASTLGLRALSDASAYCASKFGVVGFSRALAAELQGEVGVTMLVPGGMATAFFDGRPEQYRPPADARLASPADVADAVVFALTRPPEIELRELVVTAPVEPSWP
jgi:NAD(P)-dependent dehydrogenase (short-subunit alcohol dehydrogenase family)